MFTTIPAQKKMPDNVISVVFFGTPAFALPSLEALMENGYSIAAIITRPDERAGRKKNLASPPVKILAEHCRIPVFQPQTLDAKRFADEIPQADIFIVASYGKIIPKDILNIPRLGCLNIHPSLLPRWRGPSPIQYAILSGDRETGVSIMQMDEIMDHGPIVAKQHAPCNMQQEIYSTLHEKLSRIGAELLIETLPKWIRGEITPRAQDDTQATYSKILTRDDGRIDWKKPADEIERMIRAFTPWPGAWTRWQTESKILRVRIEKADWIPDMNPESAPGRVWQDAQRPLMISSGRGSLAVKRIGVEGKKISDALSFIRGYPLIIDTTVISHRDLCKTSFRSKHP